VADKFGSKVKMSCHDFATPGSSLLQDKKLEAGDCARANRGAPICLASGPLSRPSSSGVFNRTVRSEDPKRPYQPTSRRRTVRAAALRVECRQRSKNLGGIPSQLTCSVSGQPAEPAPCIATYLYDAIAPGIPRCRMAKKLKRHQEREVVRRWRL
jgi:hypothetical protein